jgi:hypothetical protein
MAKSLKDISMYNIYMTDTQTTFTETYDEEAVQYLLKLTPTQLKDEFFKDMDLDKEGRKYNFGIMSNLVREVCRDAVKQNYQVKQKYKFASFMKEGRLYVKGQGLQVLSSELRKLLNGSKCYDLDIENAHFRLMYNLVKQYNAHHIDSPLACKHLKEYVHNRWKVINSTSTNKMEFICMLYTDKIKTNKKDKVGYYPPNDFCREFHKEKQDIVKAFHEMRKDDFPYWKVKNDENPLSAWFGKYLTIFENNEIQKAMTYINSINGVVEFPMYDGICVRRGLQILQVVNDLNCLTDGIVWVEKDNLSYYVYDEDIQEQTGLDYNTRKEEFEETRCMIENPYIFIQQIKDKEGRMEDVIYSESEFAKKHRNYRVLKKFTSPNDPDPTESICKQWNEDEDIRKYNGLDFIPYSNIDIDDRHQDEFYNMFRPFTAKVIPKEEWSEPNPEWFLDYIVNGLADGNQEKADWLLGWFTHLVKHPEINQEVCLVLRGNQGTGKDTITYILGRIFGEANNYIHRTSDMYEAFPEKAGFNSCLKNKLLLQFNEVDGADTAKVKNKLKDSITRKVNKINEKYIKEYTQTNFVQCILCSNSKSPIQIEWGDRRMTVMKTADFHIGSEGKEYWSDLYRNYINNDQKINELYSWLISEIDITDFNAGRDRVKTSEYNRLSESQIPPNVLYLKHLAENSFSEWTSWTNKTTGTEYVFTQPRNFVDSGRHWIKQSLKVEYNIKSNEFQRDLLEFEGVEWNKSVKIKGKSTRFIWIEKAKFITDIQTKYKQANDDDDVLEIELDDCGGCLIDIDSDDDTDDLDM